MNNDVKKIINSIETKIDLVQLETICAASYSPKYIATVWKMYKYISEKSDKLFWIASGNTVGYYKYNGHIPWDDDIDIGFHTDDYFSNYIDFLEICIKDRFIVNLHMKKDYNDNNTIWYENDKVVNLLLDSDKNNPPWNHIKVSELRKIMKNNPDRLYFGNITMKDSKWLKLSKKLEIDELYRWTGNHLVAPWIDIIPHCQKNNSLVCHLKGLNADLSTEFIYKDFLGVQGKFPINLLDAILYQYNEKRSFDNFITWDTIYSHIKNTKMIFQYNQYPELLIFIKEYIKKYNQELLKYMDMISFYDL